MSELAYFVNHTITVAWLALAGVYVYYAVIADMVTVARGNKKAKEPSQPKG